MDDDLGIELMTFLGVMREEKNPLANMKFKAQHPYAIKIRKIQSIHINLLTYANNQTYKRHN